MNKHGHMNFEWKNDIFIIEVEGPFNEIGIESLFSELKKSVEDKGVKVWRRLEIWNEDVSGSPKTMEIGQSIFDWHEKNGCVLTAIVVSNCIQEWILAKMTNRLQIFRTIEQAEDWLNTTEKNISLPTCN